MQKASQWKESKWMHSGKMLVLIFVFALLRTQALVDRSVNTVVVAKWWYSASIIPSTFICWHSTVR